MSFKYKSAEKFRGNISGSSKFSKIILKTAKSKWGGFKQKLRLYNLEETLAATSERPLERINRSFGIAWNTKQSYKEHYQVQRESQWTRFKRLSLKSTKAIVRLPLNSHNHNFSKQSLNFLVLWESRLDTSLWKSKLVPTMKTARQYINHGFVYVNKRKSVQASRVLTSGDLVQLNLPVDLQEKHRIILSQEFAINHFRDRQLVPFHLEVHFSSGNFVFTGLPRSKDLYYPYPLRVSKLFQ